MKYKVGDRVCYKHQNPNDNVEVGEVGTICGISELTGSYGVAFETKDVYKHSCDGLCEDYYGWWCDENTLEPVDADGGKIVYAPNGAPLFWVPTPEKPVSIEEQLGLPKGVSIHDLPTSEWYKHFTVVKKEEKKMPTKFTFYVKEGTRPDKKCNGTIPTMTTNIELFDGNVFDYVTTIRGSATCDKADYDERQGVLEALANAVCGGEFEKRYSKAVKANKDADLIMRTCTYCGKVCDTSEEKIEHEKWHVERKKARRERYLLRKRAKEIAFEEQAQKMAQEIIAEDNKK